MQYQVKPTTEANYACQDLQRVEDYESIGWRYQLTTKTVFNGLQKQFSEYFLKLKILQ